MTARHELRELRDAREDFDGQPTRPASWPAQLPGAFYRAVQEFNRGEYYRCHETLEAIWIPETGTVRELYQGALQISVGCFHLTQRANRRGAISLLERGARRLDRAVSVNPDVSSLYDINWSGLIAAADRLQFHLRQGGNDSDIGYVHSLLPTISRP